MFCVYGHGSWQRFPLKVSAPIYYPDFRSMAPVWTLSINYMNSWSCFANLIPGSCHTMSSAGCLLNHANHATPRQLWILIVHSASFLRGLCDLFCRKYPCLNHKYRRLCSQVLLVATLTRNVAAPAAAVVLFRSPSIASNKISASGAPTDVAFPPFRTDFSSAWLSHK